MKLYAKVEKTLTATMSKLSDFIGKPYVFAVVLLLSLTWFVSGLFVEYEIWFSSMDLIVFMSTFFLLFVVQSSQNADTQAIQDKLDAIIESIPGADTSKEREEKLFKSGRKKPKS